MVGNPCQGLGVMRLVATYVRAQPCACVCVWCVYVCGVCVCVCVCGVCGGVPDIIPIL